jgi:hypothetical protein
MQKDARDLLEVWRFELFEETVGSWLRSIIRVLRKSGWLFDLDRSSSILGKISERAFVRSSLEAILIDLE